MNLLSYIDDPSHLWALPEATLKGYRDAAKLLGDRDIEARAPGTSMQAENGVAVISIAGPIDYRASTFTAFFGGSSVQAIRAALRQALSDSLIGSIVLALDSPGGSVSGIQELSAEIYAARDRKKIIAQVDTMAASAAYWLCASASEIVSTPSGTAGSIGVITMHVDESEAVAREGLKPTIISAGKYKNEGSSLGPLTDEALAHIQSRVDAMYDQFVNDVARGRGVTSAAVKSGYGQARLLAAKDAKAAGLIDRIGTMDETIGRLVGRKASIGMRADGQVGALRADVQVLVCDCSPECACQNGGVCGENCSTCAADCSCIAEETTTATPTPMPTTDAAAALDLDRAARLRLL